MKIFKLQVMIMAVLLLTGCATLFPRPKTLEEEQAESYTYQLNETFVVQGKVAFGMTDEQVIRTWGEPDRKQSIGNQVYWYYESGENFYQVVFRHSPYRDFRSGQEKWIDILIVREVNKY